MSLNFLGKIICWVGLLTLGGLSGCDAAELPVSNPIPTPIQGSLRVSFQFGEQALPPKSWTEKELNELPVKKSWERDPESGKNLQWSGIPLSLLLEKSMKDLSPEQKAWADYVVLKGATGTQAYLPRAFVVKYPVLLVKDDEGFRSIMPWTSRPRITKEGIPLEAYFLRGIREIEIIHFRQEFKSYVLKRRTDPTALRGEKVFIQNCLVCHAGGKGPGLESLVSGEHRSVLENSQSWKHPKVDGFDPLSSSERKGLKRYVESLKNASEPTASP